MVTKILPTLLGLVSLALALSPALAKSETCTGILPPANTVQGPKRPLTARDLITIRDIGPNWNNDVAAPILTVSPDGSKVAFQLSRADPSSNTYCLAMVAMDLRSSGKPTVMNLGGKIILMKQVFHELADYPSGLPKAIEAKWSPDGKWIAFLRQDDGAVQLWRAKVDGTFSQAVTHVAFDVEDFAWDPSGEAIIFSGRPGLKKAEGALATEGEQGFLFDDRFVPAAAKSPFPRATADVSVFKINLQAGDWIELPSDEGTPLAAVKEEAPPSGAQSPGVSDQGSRAWIVADDPSSVTSSTHIVVRSAEHKEVACSSALCSNAKTLWWATDDKAIFFFRREGWALSGLGLYRWNLDEQAPSKIMSTDDVLVGCQLAGDRLLCGFETSLVPRRLVSVDLAHGTITQLFDPNPEFASLQMGQVQRMHWKNDLGIESFGDLVLPVDYKPGHPVPLIVVQYRTRGFLRGGTGDEYPIQAFANRGFAVLSFDCPLEVAIVQKAKSWSEITKMDRVNWTDRKSILSSLNVALDELIAQKVVDPDRLGLTGLSDGSSTVRFALINDNRYKAAAISSCCDDPTAVDVLSNANVKKWMLDMGYPSLSASDSAFWNAVSFTVNATRLKTPLLMQLPDDEYLLALEGFTALREHNSPVEMFVFPNEHHIKWQPIHKLAVYERSVDWFDFWLNGSEDENPLKAPQYLRWEALRATSRR